jgi:hypothetical protein
MKASERPVCHALPNSHKNRHPEAERLTNESQETALVARSRRACPERSRGNPGGARLTDALLAFSTSKTEAHVHLFNNPFATSGRSGSVMTHIQFVAFSPGGAR